MKNLQLQVLEEEGKLEKEERARYESEIEYERGLAEEGYVHISDMETYNKLAKDLNVTAETYGQFFYKDPSNSRIYLKPSDELSVAEAKSLGVPFGTTKQQALKMGITPSSKTTTTQDKSQWSQTGANQLYSQYIAGEYSHEEARQRVMDLTGYTPKGINYSASTIPNELKGELINNIQTGEDLSSLSSVYDDVSSSYLNSLYGQYSPSSKSSESEMTDEEFQEFLNSK